MAGARVTHYADTVGAVTAGGYTRTLGEVGFDTALRASGTFDYQNAQWDINGLRHLFTPRLSYRYIPEADRGRARIPQIDRQTFSTYLPPLGLGETRNIDALRATTGEIRQQIQRIEAARDTTSSIAKSHKHQGHRKWVAQR